MKIKKKTTLSIYYKNFKPIFENSWILLSTIIHTCS
jgi:hypothetical protein